MAIGQELKIGIVSGIGGLALGSGLGYVAGRSSSSSRKKRKSSASSKKRNKTRSKSRKKRIRRTPRTAGKGRDRSTRRIRQTKNGQPYIILKSGKARFISKRSARVSRRRKGGRY